MYIYYGDQEKKTVKCYFKRQISTFIKSIEYHQLFIDHQ